MNTDHLKVFADLANTESYTKTAKNMYMSQPAVSQIIKSLENALDVKLFERSRSGVRLSACGTVFLHDITPILSQLDKAIENVQSASERFDSAVSVGYSGTVLETRKVGELQKFLHRHQNVTIHMENLNMQSLKQQLQDGQCDMIFQIKDPWINDDEFDFFPLEEGKFVVVMSTNNLLCKKNILDIDDIKNEPLILLNRTQCAYEQQKIQDILKQSNLKKMYYYLDSYALLHEMVRKELGIAILPDFLEDPLQNDLCMVPLQYDVQLEYGIITIKNNHNPIVRQIIEEVALHHITNNHSN